jgi:hypothetical protein
MRRFRSRGLEKRVFTVDHRHVDDQGRRNSRLVLVAFVVIILGVLGTLAATIGLYVKGEGSETWAVWLPAGICFVLVLAGLLDLFESSSDD